MVEKDSVNINKATVQQTIRITPAQKELLYKVVESGDATGISDAIRKAIDRTYCEKENKPSIAKVRSGKHVKKGKGNKTGKHAK